MIQQPVIDRPVDNEQETRDPAPRGGRYADLLGTFPEADEEFRQAIREMRKFSRRRDPL